ncbi:MAG: tRNA (N6-isopentenyl adenosine(37)-C2)-methylthiotransferase MiaB [Treponemataceae bacterium]
MKYFFETYGCQMNKAESAALELELNRRGWTIAENAENADLVLVNTCSVRATAETRVIGRLAHFAAEKRKRPFKLIVAGCMAERLKDSLKDASPAVDYVMGTAARSFFPRILDSIEKSAPLAGLDESPVFSFSTSYYEPGAFRSFVPIMHGCDNFCSYCIVPYVRGREISRSPDSILEEISMLEQKGVLEITLLGQNVNSYRWVDPSGLVVDFPALLRLVADRVQSIRWVRFLSSHPKDLSSAVIAVLKEYPVFCRHIHLCVQHGSNRILAAMNRRYTRERYLELVDEIRSELPGVSLSTDILIGFPGETEEDLEETLDLMKRVRFSNAYMYHYNPREGTAAYALPGRIDEAVKKERLARVIELQLAQTKEAMRSRVGFRETVIVDCVAKRNTNELLSRTQRDEMVVFPGDASMIGRFVDLEISSLRGMTFRSKGLE